MTTTKDEAINLLREALKTCTYKNYRDTDGAHRKIYRFDAPLVKLALGATSHIAPDAAPRGKRDILAICDAYESGMGHGLERDGHKSGAIFDNPECGEAYELGYEEGFERSGEASPAIAPEESELDTPDFWKLVRKYSMAPEGAPRQAAANAVLSHIAMHRAAAAKPDEQPKLVLALPDHEKRQIVIASDEVIDDERIVCVGIKDLVAAEPVPTDLSKKLRKAACLSMVGLNKLLTDAADEIDRLAATKPAASEAVGDHALALRELVELIDFAAKRNADARSVKHSLTMERARLALAAPAAPTDAKQS